MSYGGGYSVAGNATRPALMGARAAPIFTSTSSSSPSGASTTEKKPRKNRACLSCKSGHLKCDHGLPSCARCTARGIPCVYTESAAPAAPTRPLVFVDHAFHERSTGSPTTTVYGEEMYSPSMAPGASSKSSNGMIADATVGHMGYAQHNQHHHMGYQGPSQVHSAASATSPSSLMSPPSLSPSSGDYTLAHGLSGTSPLSATGFHTLSMNPMDSHGMNLDGAGNHAQGFGQYQVDLYASSGHSYGHPSDGMDYSGYSNALSAHPHHISHPHNMHGQAHNQHHTLSTRGSGFGSQQSFRSSSKASTASSGFAQSQNANWSSYNHGSGSQTFINANDSSADTPASSSTTSTSSTSKHGSTGRHKRSPQSTATSLLQASSKINATTTSSPPQSPKLRLRQNRNQAQQQHQQQQSNASLAGSAANGGAGSAPSSATSNSAGLLSGVSPANTAGFSLPSSPQTAHTGLSGDDASSFQFSYDGSSMYSASSSPHTSHTNSPHSLGYMGQTPLQGEWGAEEPNAQYHYMVMNQQGPVHSLHHQHQVQHMMPSGSHSTISHWSTNAAVAGYSSDASSLDSDLPSSMQPSYFMRHSVSPSHRDNPLLQSGPVPNNTRFVSSGASSLPTNLPSSAIPPYGSVQYSPAHAQFMDALGSGFNTKTDPNAEFYATDPSATSLSGAAFTYSGSDMVTDNEIKDSLMDTTSPGVDLSRTPQPLEIESPAMRRNAASPSLVAINRSSNNVSPGRRSGSGPIGYSASELRGRSSPAIVTHLSQYGGSLPTPGGTGTGSSNHLAPPGSGMAVDSPPGTTRSPAGNSTPRSFSPNSGRQTFVRGSSSKSPGANQMDTELAELLQVLDAFVTVFEPRGPINMDISWTHQEARPYWQLLMKDTERRDEVGLLLQELQGQLSSANDHAPGLKKCIRLFEHCVMLLCGSSSLNWHGVEVRLAAQAEKMVPFCSPEVLNFEAVDVKDKDCDRLIDALALYAAYFRDRQQIPQALNALMLAYNLMSSNAAKLSIEAIDRLYIWTLYCVSMPQERSQWIGMISSLGVHPGQTPMAMMVTQQAGLVSSFAAGPLPNREQLMRLWKQLDEFEQLIQLCEKSHRSRAFRYLRIASASILRAEVLTRFENTNDAQLWIRHLQDIASMSPGLKVSLITSIKAISEQVVDGEIRGLTCAPAILSLLESTQTNLLQ